MIPLSWTLGAVAVTALVAGGAGLKAGMAWVQGQWDRDTVQRQQAEQRQRNADLDTAYTLAAEYEARSHDMEAAYAQASTQLRKALQRPIACPAGQTLGDVVLPAAVLDSLRAAGGDGTPGPAAPEPER